MDLMTTYNLGKCIVGILHNYMKLKFKKKGFTVQEKNQSIKLHNVNKNGNNCSSKRK